MTHTRNGFGKNREGKWWNDELDAVKWRRREEPRTRSEGQEKVGDDTHGVKITERGQESNRRARVSEENRKMEGGSIK